MAEAPCTGAAQTVVQGLGPCGRWRKRLARRLGTGQSAHLRCLCLAACPGPCASRCADCLQATFTRASRCAGCLQATFTRASRCAGCLQATFGRASRCAGLLQATVTRVDVVRAAGTGPQGSQPLGGTICMSFVAGRAVVQAGSKWADEVAVLAQPERTVAAHGRGCGKRACAARKRGYPSGSPMDGPFCSEMNTGKDRHENASRWISPD